MTVLGDTPTDGAPTTEGEGVDPLTPRANQPERLLSPVSSPPSVVGDPKPAARIVDRKAFARFYADSWGFPCQVCGKPRPWQVSVHHIIPRGQGGDDVPANFALLCGHGTVGCHGDVEARRNGARERLRAAMTSDQLAYVTQKKSQAWLDRMYPLACPECGETIINKGAHFERCYGRPVR